tara:strand:+ start:669 stop:809 length:141 start_codon:yes stop_codon:yes gene_type:complete
MKTQKEIKKKIKKATESMLNSSGSMFVYWLGFKRALEWLFLKDTSK